MLNVNKQKNKNQGVSRNLDDVKHLLLHNPKRKSPHSRVSHLWDSFSKAQWDSSHDQCCSCIKGWWVSFLSNYLKSITKLYNDGGFLMHFCMCCLYRCTITFQVNDQAFMLKKILKHYNRSHYTVLFPNRPTSLYLTSQYIRL